MDLDNQIRRLQHIIKRPIWHWLSPMILGLLVISMAFSFVTQEKDTRKVYLDADLAKMTIDPTTETDIISFKIKKLLDVFMIEALSPQSISYYTRVEDDRALVLIEIPKFEHLERKARPGLLEMITPVLDKQANLDGKDYYFAVKGKNNMMLVKTPTVFENSNFASEDGIYEFYGPID
jgi:hypothetical protein